MPGYLLPPSTVDPRWKNKLRLQLQVLNEDGNSQEVSVCTKLSDVLIAASKELAEDWDGLESVNDSDKEKSGL